MPKMTPFVAMVKESKQPREGGSELKPIYLWDLVIAVAGWSPNLDTAIELLERADQVLPSGRYCRDPLTIGQIESLESENRREESHSSAPKGKTKNLR
jgi:hypothetical protein